MTWLLIALVLIVVAAADRKQVIRGTLLAVATRVGARAYGAYARHRRARALRWINEWRVENRLVPRQELCKAVRGSARHGVIARNMGVIAYADGMWTDRNGRSGSVPGYVAAFARDFDAGHFEELAGRLVAVDAPAPAAHGAVGLAWKQTSAIS
jgi:hypothetical protein